MALLLVRPPICQLTDRYAVRTSEMCRVPSRLGETGMAIVRDIVFLIDLNWAAMPVSLSRQAPKRFQARQTPTRARQLSCGSAIERAACGYTSVPHRGAMCTRGYP